MDPRETSINNVYTFLTKEFTVVDDLLNDDSLHNTIDDTINKMVSDRDDYLDKMNNRKIKGLPSKHGQLRLKRSPYDNLVDLGIISETKNSGPNIKMEYLQILTKSSKLSGSLRDFISDIMRTSFTNLVESYRVNLTKGVYFSHKKSKKQLYKITRIDNTNPLVDVQFIDFTDPKVEPIITYTTLEISKVVKSFKLGTMKIVNKTLVDTVKANTLV